MTYYRIETLGVISKTPPQPEDREVIRAEVNIVEIRMEIRKDNI
jgi:hypothetical protein